ncbi:12587_t:CDS:2 [Cetraspora pellucida]|uniref:12587_t:CDS:1 n=1 Tax=Cetraspora pellucida TaxID=1433469 RepID=A0ACA9K0W5_9GLOM|nr:12587_t:CDS:2 [Cetraspora pellucida]
MPDLYYSSALKIGRLEPLLSEDARCRNKNEQSIIMSAQYN